MEAFHASDADSIFVSRYKIIGNQLALRGETAENSQKTVNVVRQWGAIASFLLVVEINAEIGLVGASDRVCSHQHRKK